MGAVFGGGPHGGVTWCLLTAAALGLSSVVVSGRPESTTTCGEITEDASAEALIAWVRAGGGEVSPLQAIQTVDGLRGIVALADIPADTTLARVPWSHLLAYETQCGAVSDLRAHLENGEQSKYFPYLESMKTYAPNMPFLWRDTALEAIEALPPYDWTRHRAWFEAECGGDLEGDPLTRRALELFLPRSVGGEGQFVMCPIFDLYNHRNGAFDNTRIRIATGDALEVYAARDVAAGEQLYYSYGRLTTDLFRDYAFVEQLPQRWHLSDVYDFSLFSSEGELFEDTPTVEWVSSVPASREAFTVAIASILADLARPLPPLAPHLQKSEKADPVLATHMALALAYRSALASAIDAARRSLPTEAEIEAEAFEEASQEEEEDAAMEKNAALEDEL